MPENYASFRLVNNILGGRDVPCLSVVVSRVQLKVNTLTADRHVGKNGATRTSFWTWQKFTKEVFVTNFKENLILEILFLFDSYYFHFHFSYLFIFIFFLRFRLMVDKII